MASEGHTYREFLRQHLEAVFKRVLEDVEELLILEPVSKRKRLWCIRVDKASIDSKTSTPTSYGVAAAKK